MLKQSTNVNARPSHDEIAALAYSIFEKNGRIPGRDKENWLQAEKQLLATRQSTEGSNATARPVAKPNHRT